MISPRLVADGLKPSGDERTRSLSSVDREQWGAIPLTGAK